MQLSSPSMNSDASPNPYVQGEMAVPEDFLTSCCPQRPHLLSYADRPAAIPNLRVAQPQEQKSKN